MKIPLLGFWPCTTIGSVDERPPFKMSHTKSTPFLNGRLPGRNTILWFDLARGGWLLRRQWYDTIPYLLLLTLQYSTLLLLTAIKNGILVVFFDSFFRLSVGLVLCVLCYISAMVFCIDLFNITAFLCFYFYFYFLLLCVWWQIEDGIPHPTPKAFDQKTTKKANSIQLREFRISGTERHFALLVPSYRFLDFMIYVVCCVCITWLATQSSRTSYSQWSQL